MERLRVEIKSEGGKSYLNTISNNKKYIFERN